MITEISEIKIIEANSVHNLVLPLNYWLNNLNNWKDIILEIIDPELNKIVKTPFKNENLMICNEKDLESFFLSHNLNVSKDLNFFRLKLSETKKWGMKPLFIDGYNSICFSCFQFETIDFKYFMYYNTSGTKSVESIYFHGLWKLKK